MANFTGETVELLKEHYPEETDEVLQLLNGVNDIVSEGVMVLVQTNLGQDILVRWNELDNKDAIIGAGRVLGFILPGLSVSKIKALKNLDTQNNDANLLESYLSPSQITAIRNRTWTMRLFFGTVLEERVEQLARNKQWYDGVQHTANNAPQDFITPDGLSIRKHQARPDVDVVVTYGSIPSSFGYDWINEIDTP